MTLPYTFASDRAELIARRNNTAYDPATGLSAEKLREACASIAVGEKNAVRRTAELLCFVFDHAQLEICPHELFADHINGAGVIPGRRDAMRKLYRERRPDIFAETDIGEKCGAYTGDDDFGHTCPDYVSIIKLGVPGIAKRLEDARDAAVAPEKREFFADCARVWRAMQRLLVRFSEAVGRYADKCPTAAIQSRTLRVLSERPPQTLHEVLQLILFVYRMQTDVEHVFVRTLGRLDVLITPFMGADDDENREIFRYFLERMNDPHVSANIPITLGGEDVADDARITDTAMTLLAVYGELGNISPKFQIRVGPHTPKKLLYQVLTLIRAGSNSFVFCCDESVTAALIKNGHTPEDAMNYVMIGCYESSTMGAEAACTCCGRVILPKAVECALNGGRELAKELPVGLECPEDFADFDAFFAEVKRQASYFAEQSMRRTAAMEELYPEVGASPIMSGSMACCLESGRDVYAGGAKYNYSSVNIFGTATAADSLAAIRKLVFEDRTLTLAELRGILKNNWEGNEKLRLIVSKTFPKYGNGDASVDALAAELLSSAAKTVNGYPNGRGGVFRAGAFSIDWRLHFGKLCAASADGRLAGEVLSKNMCASDGADRCGVTALCDSACTFDYTELSNGTVLDLVLHASAAAGEDGMTALLGLVETFIARGGLAVQINILDPSVLRRAQEEPEKYENLQIRLCGWNVLFVNLCRHEQDEFIRWSEN